MKLTIKIILFFVLIISISNNELTENNFYNNINQYNSDIKLLNNNPDKIEESVQLIIDFIEKLISNALALSIYNATTNTTNQTDKISLEDVKKCQDSYSMLFEDNNLKERKYFLSLLFYDSSKSRNDLGSYIDCLENQTISLKNLNVTIQEKKQFQKNSTFVVIQVIEKKHKMFYDIGYQENEFFVGLCLKKGCSEAILRKTFYELNKEIAFFEEFRYEDIQVYDLDEKNINKILYVYYWIPFFIIVIIILFSCLKCIPNIVFSKLNHRKFNEMKECFNLKNNYAEILGNPLDNENIVSNDSGITIIKGIRGLNMIAVLVSSSFFYIFHLPTKIYNKDTFKSFITSLSFVIVYFGARFGIKFLYAISGFELVYKMLNYLDNCIENKEKMAISNDKKDDLINKDYNIINDLDDDSDDYSSLKKNSKIEKKDMISLKEKNKKIKIEEKEEEGDEEEEEEEEDDDKESKETKELKVKSEKDKAIMSIKEKLSINKKKKKEEENNKNYFSDFENIDLTNEAEINKLEAINKLLYKRHRNKLEGKILFNFIIKQWHKYMMFILAIFFFKYSVITPLLVFDRRPMWLIHLRKIADKFRPIHILSNLLCFSPFSYTTYNEIDPFGMAYNEVFFFIVGSILIFYSYKYCLRLDSLTIILSIFFFLVKLGIGIYFCFFFETQNTNDANKNDAINPEEVTKEHGFYPLMFFQYNEENLKIKSYFFSNQFFNIPFFLLGIFFGEMNYSLQNFSKANDRNKRYLILPKILLNFFSRKKKMRIFYFIISLIIFIICVIAYYIMIVTADENLENFFFKPWFNLVGLIDSDIGVLSIFFCILILLLSGDNIFVNFLKHKYWGIFSRTYWCFILCLHICNCFIFYLSENRIKIIFYNVIFFSFEILMVVVIVITIIYVGVEIPFKKMNKIFIKNRDELIFDYKQIN